MSVYSDKKNKDWVAILDFGSQYTHLIARRIRELSIYCEIIPYNTQAEKISQLGPRAIILSGGPASVTAGSSPDCDKDIFNLGIPVLGVCYGMHLMAKLLGGHVTQAKRREYGKAVLGVKDKNGILTGLADREDIWMSHADKILSLPDDFTVSAATDNCPLAVIENKKRKFYGLQFHPEVVHTHSGKKILDNFLSNIAGCKAQWNLGDFTKDSINDLAHQLRGEKVICALSGGVDSSVLAMLLHKAIGQNLIAIFVDNGLLRKNEAEIIKERFKNNYKINLQTIKAEAEFLKNLGGVTDPEKKRKVIGKTFIDIFQRQAKKAGEVNFLAQGTLYPDVIESKSPLGGPSATIKTHHNVGGLPKKLNFKLVEPLKDLFKDEVRIVGKELGLSDDIIKRQPFPGPGLAIRIIGQVTKPRLDILREADRIFSDEIKKDNLYYELWQSFCVLLPVKTVGVMGDQRSYEDVIALRAVISDDAMTAHWAKLPYELLERTSNRIINEVKGVNRVVYDISSKPPSTIEWE